MSHLSIYGINSLPSSHTSTDPNDSFTMLNFAPPNDQSQNETIAQTKAQLQQEAWNPAPNWMCKLRHLKSETDPNIYQTNSSVAHTHVSAPMNLIEDIARLRYARINKDNKTLPKASLDPIEQQVFTSHDSDENDPMAAIQTLLPTNPPASDDSDKKDPFDADHPLRAPEQGTYASYKDVRKWDAQARNLKQSAPQLSVEYEGEGLVGTIFAKSDDATRKVRRKGKGLSNKKKESASDSGDEGRADSVIEGIKTLARRYC
jgi:hypothetical protein